MKTLMRKLAEAAGGYRSPGIIRNDTQRPPQPKIERPRTTTEAISRSWKSAADGLGHGLLRSKRMSPRAALARALKNIQPKDAGTGA